MPLSDLWDWGSHESEPEEPLHSQEEEANGGPDQDLKANHKALKRKLQTAAARAAKAVKQARAAAPSQTGETAEKDPTSFAKRLQRAFFTLRPHLTTSNPNEANTDVKQQFARERARAVWSLLVHLKDTVVKLFQCTDNVEHALNVCVADDTSTKLKASSGRNIVHTIMNTIEWAHIRFANGDWQCLYLPTAMRVLSSGQATSIHQSFTSFLLLTAQGPGIFWRRMGLENGLLSRTLWKSTVFMGDALKANDKAWKSERALRAEQADAYSLGVRLRCGNHQLCLVRRPAVLSIEKFWTTVVRLGHLMEQSNFRRNLASAIVRFLSREGNFVRAWVGHQRQFCF